MLPRFKLASSARTTILRALLVTPFAIGVLAGTITTGTSAADPASTKSGSTLATPPPGSPSPYRWKVINYTAKPLTDVRFVKWDETMFWSRTDTSELTAAVIDPSGRVAADFLTPDGDDRIRNHTFGSLCYGGVRWEMPTQSTEGAQWDEVGIFAGPNGKGGEQLIATPKHAHDDRGLVYRGVCVRYFSHIRPDTASRFMLPKRQPSRSCVT